MDKPISVGDLVVIVRWPCCGLFIGAIARVEEIETFNDIGGSRCCGYIHKELQGHPYAKTTRGPNSKWPLEWIKRIPPLDELESVKTQEPIHEPV